MTGPRPGDFGLQSGSGWAGWMIRLGTFSRFGHACVVVAVDGDTIEIVEAVRTGARRRTCTRDEFLWSACPLTDGQRASIVADTLSCVGLPYDFPAIFGFIVRFWGARFTNQSGDHADDKVICSEIPAWGYRRAGHELAKSRTIAPGDVSPGDMGAHMLAEDAARLG